MDILLRSSESVTCLGQEPVRSVERIQMRRQSALYRAPESTCDFSRRPLPVIPGSVPVPSGVVASMDFGHERLVVYRWTDVCFVVLPRRQSDLVVRQFPVRDHAQKMADAIESGTLLVVRIHDIPGSLFDVRVGEHIILGL